MLRLTVALLLICGTAGAQNSAWTPLGLSGGGGMNTPAVSPADPNEMMVNCDMSGAYISLDGGLNWRMINCSQLRSSTRCRPAFHPTDPKTVYAADGWNGVKVSHDRGVTWTFTGKLPDEPHGEICINPSDPSKIMVGAGDSVFLSTNAGSSWDKCTGPSGYPLAFHFDLSQKNICFAATDAGLWRSSDSGKTWSKLSQGLPDAKILTFAAASHPTAGTMLYCSTPGSAGPNGEYVGGIFSSADRGETWQSAMGAGINKETKAFDEWAMGPVAQYIHIAACDANPQVIWAINTNTGVPAPHHVSAYRSDDAGKTWRSTFQADPRFEKCNVPADYTVTMDRQYYQSVPEPAVDQKNPDHVLLISEGPCYTTIDGGKSWRTGHTRRAQDAADGISRWTCTGLVVTTTWNYYLDPFVPDRHYICYTDLGFAISTDKGQSWAWWPEKGRAPWRNTCYELAFDPSVKGRIFGAFSNVHDIPNDNIISGRHGSTGPGGICVSDDHGINWKTANAGLPLKATTSIILDPRSPVNSRVLYAGQFGGGVWKSADGGKSWMEKNNGLGTEKNRRVNRVILHKDGSLIAVITGRREGRVFMDDGVGLYRSIDGGDHWTQINTTQRLLWLKDITVDPADSKIIYISAANANGDNQGGLYRTVDGGKTWKKLASKGPEHFGAYLSPFHKGWIYMTLTEGAPDCGLWLSKDNGQTWAAMKGLPFANAQRVTFDPKDSTVIYVTTFGGSIWRGPADI